MHVKIVLIEDVQRTGSFNLPTHLSSLGFPTFLAQNSLRRTLDLFLFFLESPFEAADAAVAAAVEALPVVTRSSSLKSVQSPRPMELTGLSQFHLSDD